jgi:hypothetical protein
MFPFVETAIFAGVYTLLGFVMPHVVPVLPSSNKKEILTYHNYLVSLVHALVCIVLGTVLAHIIALIKLAVYGISFCEANTPLMELMIAVI